MKLFLISQKLKVYSFLTSWFFYLLSICNITFIFVSKVTLMIEIEIIKNRNIKYKVV